ncbi:MAG TPA: protein translocase subunit SecF [Bacteroidetes bacterium]|nr:protein translocase subunit SecF [Bacteroidota bacterium]
MRFFKKTNIDFLKPRRWAYLGSSLLITAGIVSMIVKGIDFGIDFRGGTELVLKFEHPVEIGQLRTALSTVGLGQSQIKTFGSDESILIRTAESGSGTSVGSAIKNAVQTALPDAKFTVLKEDKVGPKIGAELRRDALYAAIASLIAILGYIAIRFKFIYGAGAVVAVFHDVLTTLSFMSLLNGVIPGLNLEISLEVVAALLTLVGVSVNDTVVVFDRIRENLKVHRTMSIGEVINRSQNDMLGRTIITNGTIFIVLLVLLLGGGEVTRGFAFAMTIGTITGSYSTIYIASAIVMDWSIRKQKTA